MPMLKNARGEKLAQEYVKNCGDEVSAYRVAYPEISEGKTDAKVKKAFAGAYAKDALFWRRVAELQKPVEQEIALTAKKIISEWADIALADATKISGVETRYEAHRTCEDDVDGYDPTCGVCGAPRAAYQTVYLADTRDLTGPEKKLFKSAEVTKNGIKIHLRDQDAALINAAKALGMFTIKLQVSETDKPELPPLPDDPIEAARLYTEWVKGA